MNFVKELEELQAKTPRIGQIRLNNVNSDYTAQTDRLKNCYLIANAVGNEDCMYGRDFYGNTDCADCDHVRECILCYECLNCERCYDCRDLQDCTGCNNCEYGYDLVSCKNCFGCSGLRNKEYHIFNELVSALEYEKRIAELSSEEVWAGFEKVKKNVPRVYAMQSKSENFTGNYVYHCQNTHECFDVVECQDVGYLIECKNMRDCYDVSILEDAELCYNISSSHVLTNCNCCYFCVTSVNCDHSELLFNCEDCFGCISLQRKKYHILNKPYEKEEYFKKVAEIKEELGSMYGEMLIPPTYEVDDTVLVWPTM
jgi:hypothetical protein